jgi:hypothetical protein
MKTLNDYLNLITSQHRNKPKFIGTVSIGLSVLVEIQGVIASMVDAFDIDLAVGVQLDIIGQWAGVSRDVAIPISNVYFSWDGVYTLGWDYGTWQPNEAPTSITTLPDDAYRTLIRAKIAANQWDGTTDGAYAIWESLFPQFKILIQDNQDMSYDLAVVGGIVDSLTLALITGGYIPLKPEGVQVNSYYVSVDSGKVFGWDVESDYLGGWDEASWVREIKPT